MDADSELAKGERRVGRAANCSWQGETQKRGNPSCRESSRMAVAMRRKPGFVAALLRWEWQFATDMDNQKT